jgi:hypothetical protein
MLNNHHSIVLNLTTHHSRKSWLRSNLKMTKKQILPIANTFNKMNKTPYIINKPSQTLFPITNPTIINKMTQQHSKVNF